MLFAGYLPSFYCWESIFFKKHIFPFSLFSSRSNGTLFFSDFPRSGLDMQESEYFGETLNGQFFQMMGSDTRGMGRFVDVVRGLAFHKVLGMFHIWLIRPQPRVTPMFFWML